MYDSIKLKLVCVSSGAPRLFDAVQYGVTDPSHSADSIGIGLNKKQIVAILYGPWVIRPFNFQFKIQN